jgi:methylmalonyl-CoA mutase N-terminal domain/subunit
MYDKNKLNELKELHEKWEETSLKKALSQLPERADEFITTSSEPINRLYTPRDIAELDYESDLGLPGEYPYTRGVHPTLHRSKLWTMRMFERALQIPSGAGSNRIEHCLRPGNFDGL